MLSLWLFVFRVVSGVELESTYLFSWSKAAGRFKKLFFLVEQNISTVSLANLSAACFYSEILDTSILETKAKFRSISILRYVKCRTILTNWWQCFLGNGMVSLNYSSTMVWFIRLPICLYFSVWCGPPHRLLIWPVSLIQNYHPPALASFPGNWMWCPKQCI